MKAWQLDRLGGSLQCNELPTPAAVPGTVLIRVEAQGLMSYLQSYVAGDLPAYRAPQDFIPGGNAIGRIAAVGQNVWHLKPGQRVVLSSHLVAQENVADPAQILLGVTSPGGIGDDVQRSWPNGTLAEYVLAPAQLVTPIEGLDSIESFALVAATRCVVPYGGLLRGELKAGETVVVNGATGAYGGAAVLVALAMGASRVVALGRRKNRLEQLASLPRVSPVVLVGNIEEDAASIRAACSGGAHVSLDIIGGASDNNSTLSALNALHRGGRLVLMGSSNAPLALNYLQIMLNDLQILGNFMFPRNAYLGLFSMVRSGQLDLSQIRPIPFGFSDLIPAMQYASQAPSFELTVLTGADLPTSGITKG